jgi:hypothetical protein
MIVVRTNNINELRWCHALSALDGYFLLFLGLRPAFLKRSFAAELTSD